MRVIFFSFTARPFFNNIVGIRYARPYPWSTTNLAFIKKKNTKFRNRKTFGKQTQRRIGVGFATIGDFRRRWPVALNHFVFFPPAPRLYEIFYRHRHTVFHSSLVSSRSSDFTWSCFIPSVASSTSFRASSGSISSKLPCRFRSRQCPYRLILCAVITFGIPAVIFQTSSAFILLRLHRQFVVVFT